MSIARDAGAVEGLPLNLMVTMIVLAITVPLVFGSFRTYDRDRTEAGLVSGIGDVIAAVQFVYTSGPGNSAAVDFKATPGSMTGIDYIIFGDEPGGDMVSAIRYKIQGRAESVVLVASPNVPMSTAGGTGLNISAGAYRIVAECTAIQQGTVQYAIVTLEIVQ